MVISSSRNGTYRRLSTLAVVVLSGCITTHEPPSRDAHAHTALDPMHHYEPAPHDPDWLAAAARFHGHLGPWVVTGARIGRDACERLAANGYWNIDVVCCLPPSQQCPPQTCMLDGLQTSTGATYGKRNIHLRDATDDAFVVYVIRTAQPSAPAQGCAYRPRPGLLDLLAKAKPGNLEAIAREVAHRPLSELFDVQPLSQDEARRLTSPGP
jgi:hypothetical protein